MMASVLSHQDQIQQHQMLELMLYSHRALQLIQIVSLVGQEQMHATSIQQLEMVMLITYLCNKSLRINLLSNSKFRFVHIFILCFDWKNLCAGNPSSLTAA